MKITALEMANVKRIRALRLEPTEKGLTIIGGRNAQGKTSVLDGIAYALGGERYRPTNLKRDGSVADATIHIETDDGLVVERRGRNAALVVTDRDGRRGGQALLDAVVSKLAIDLPRFMDATDREKADILLDTVGVGDELARLEREEKAAYDTRTAVGRMAEQKAKAAADMPWHDDAPDAPVSISDLLLRQRDVLARNGVREDRRRRYEADRASLEATRRRIRELKEAEAALAEAVRSCDTDFEPEDTSELERQIADFEETNIKVRENADRTARENEADDLKDQYDALTRDIETIRAKRRALLDGADLPYPGLSVENGALALDGKAWDCMSGAQQMIVATAIASRINPSCRFVLMDKLEQLDLDTLKEFDAWLREHDLQCLATRVSTGGECSVVIEDGEAVEPVRQANAVSAAPELGDDDY